jgi:futalosine hydrolase
MASWLTMSFKILYVTATESEAASLRRVRGIIPVPSGYRFGDIDISVLVAGVGSVSTAWALKQWFSINDRPGLAINAGIAGSYKDDIMIGNVVMPVTDCFADAGIEDGDNFITLFEAGLANANEFPFINGHISAESVYCSQLESILRPVHAITVNTATGSESTINKLLKKYNPDIETMEGATFFYLCAREKIPFLALRAISNRVEPRNRERWNITLALDNLSEKLNEVFITLK